MLNMLKNKNCCELTNCELTHRNITARASKQLSFDWWK